ncbi:MAG: hypothetical protein IPJ25_10080 [Rhodocyclaceae bacterium]|nr:hypothetical protein [Rhodocyclaceae bacterium]
MVIDQISKVSAQISADLKNPSSNRAIQFEIVRDASRKFDNKKYLTVERVIKLDVQSDVAILRVDKCLGVPEAYGSINVLPKDKIEAEFKK